MSTNYSKAELVAAVAETCGVSKKSADEILTAAFTVIREEVANGKTVNLPGFGKFMEKVRPARAGRNPRTGETVEFAESRKIAFKPTKPKAA